MKPIRSKEPFSCQDLLKSSVKASINLRRTRPLCIEIYKLINDINDFIKLIEHKSNNSTWIEKSQNPIKSFLVLQDYVYEVLIFITPFLFILTWLLGLRKLRKGWNFANRTYFASCIIKNHKHVKKVGQNLRISFWHLLMHLKNKQLLKKMLK